VNNAAMTYSDIAAKYGATDEAVRQRSVRENWPDERSKRSHALSLAVTQKSILNSVDELAKYNEQDIVIAKNLRTVAGRIIQSRHDTLDPNELRSLSTAIVNAQRVARLALGASTENSNVREEGVFDFSDFSDPELEQLVSRALRSRGAARTAPPETKPN